MIGPTNARGGGGGLNLKVVGGTTQPTNPRENTIWVNTTTAITGYVQRRADIEDTYSARHSLRPAQRALCG